MRRCNDAVGACLATVLIFSPVIASAHPLLGAGAAGSFAGGFAHPFSGWDHQLAMLAIGLWASQRRGLAGAALPLAFVVGVASALVLTPWIGALPIGAGALAATAALAGCAVALRVRAPLRFAPLVVLAFGLLHGHAHAGDLVASAAPARFAAGFVLATAALHAVGFGIARAVPPSLRAVWTAAGGGAIAIVGLALCIASAG